MRLMTRRLRLGSIFLVMMGMLLAGSVRAAPAPSAVRERLRHRLEATSGPERIVVGRQVVQSETSLRKFYTERGFAPAWSAGSRFTDQADSLLAAIEAAGLEGLSPSDYHLIPLRKALGTGPNAAVRTLGLPGIVDTELLLTDAWLLLATHCLSGKLDPTTLDPEWVVSRRQVDLSIVLETALREGTVAATLRSLLPGQPGYAWLKAGLARYRRLAAQGEWPVVPAGPLLRPGGRDPRLSVLAQRLAAERGDSLNVSGETYEQDLVDAVKSFQRRQGLKVDGIVGPSTLSALNIGVLERIDEIRVNLERWRWLPQDLGPRHIVVNIADFHLRVIEGDGLILTLPVIVGKPFRRTPVFSATMSYLVFSPVWEVPPMLAEQDKLPLIRGNPEYLATYGFEVLSGWGADERIVDPDSVRWNEMKPGRFPYRLRQKPGPLNALGGVKFMFPNKFNVYLHDTPSRELFRESVRTFSSGCIRVQDTERLAALLLGDKPEWTADAVTAAMTSGRERTVRLTRAIPVHLQYWTAWSDEHGGMEFRRDIYGRDKGVLAALSEAPPAGGR